VLGLEARSTGHTLPRVETKQFDSQYAINSELFYVKEFGNVSMETCKTVVGRSKFGILPNMQHLGPALIHLNEALLNLII
jgi:hypothetical protein